MTADEIIEKAHERSNIVPNPSASYRQGLEVLTELMDHHGSMTCALRENLTELLTANLVSRLKVEDYITRHPRLREVMVRKPVIVFGLPRTGTTLVSNLLATDPTRRSLLNWEAADPIPPPTSETLFSDPRCIRKRTAQELVLALDPRMARVHWEFADEPTECDSLFSQDFKSAHWAILFPPEYGDWLRICDMTSAYDYHKRVLQVLQSATHGYWNLKSTCHGLFVDVLRKVYPDARLIWIHRDPFKALASTCSLVRVQQATLGGEINLGLIRKMCESYVAEILKRSLLANQQMPSGTIYHLWYSRIVKAPIQQMRELCRWLGDPLTPEVENGMQFWLNTHPQGKYGNHQYRLDEFGVSESSLPAIFHDYMTDFKIEREREGCGAENEV